MVKGGNDATTLLALTLAPGVGRATAQQIIVAARRAGLTLAEFVRMPAKEAAVFFSGCGQNPVAHLSPWMDAYVAQAKSLVSAVARTGGQTLIITDNAYPSALTTFLGRQAPPLLFVLGDIDLLHIPSAAVVGARSPSPRGRLLASACADAFARAGIPVVSGGAEGVDTAAHDATLKVSGKTVVVLPQGLLTYRMPGNVARAMKAGRAAVLSEFEPSSPWQTHAAVTRNATISALAGLVCVIEPKKTGGSIRTARCAMEQGKPVIVFADRKHCVPPAWPKTSGIQLFSTSHELDPTALLRAWYTRPDTPRQNNLFENMV